MIDVFLNEDSSLVRDHIFFNDINSWFLFNRVNIKLINIELVLIQLRSREVTSSKNNATFGGHFGPRPGPLWLGRQPTPKTHLVAQTPFSATQTSTKKVLRRLAVNKQCLSVNLAAAPPDGGQRATTPLNPAQQPQGSIILLRWHICYLNEINLVNISERFIVLFFIKLITIIQWKFSLFYFHFFYWTERCHLQTEEKKDERRGKREKKIEKEDSVRWQEKSRKNYSQFNY